MISDVFLSLFSPWIRRNKDNVNALSNLYFIYCVSRVAVEGVYSVSFVLVALNAPILKELYGNVPTWAILSVFLIPFLTGSLHYIMEILAILLYRMGCY
jgi:hypothetical protein